MKNILNLDDKEYYNKLFSIGLPIAVQNLINFGVSMMDTLMLGVLGEVQLSAASIANQFSFIFMIMSFGIASGSAVMSAQYWGKGDTATIKKIVAIMYRVVFVLAVIFMTTSMIAPRFIVSVFISDEAVMSEAVKYLQIIGLSYIFSGFTNTSIGLFRSVGTVKISVVVYSVSLVTNTFLNYVLIFGKLGFPAMGIEGAAIATVISRIIETIIVLIFTFRVDKKLNMKLRELLKVDTSLIKPYIQFASPVILNEILWTTGNSLVMVTIGRMGREFVAANSICSVLFQLANAVVFGLSSAASTIIGHTVGSGDYDKVAKRARALMANAVIVGLGAAFVMYTGRYILIEFYNISEVAREYAYGITAVASFLAVFQTVCMVLMMGVLRGGGDTKYVTVTDVIFMWLVALPLGSYAGLVLGLPVPIVYLCLKCDEIIKAIVSTMRVLSNKWIKDVTR